MRNQIIDLDEVPDNFSTPKQYDSSYPSTGKSFLEGIFG